MPTTTSSTTAPAYSPLLGPVFPAPSGSLATNPTISFALSSLQQNLTALTFQTGGNSTSFSVSVASIHDSNQQPLFSFHHTASPSTLASNSTREVAADTVYRVGSVSKVFTVLALLLGGEGICLDDSVPKYVPELRDVVGLSNGSDGVERVTWEDVSLRSLGSHLAGISRDYNLADLSEQQFPLTANGFPTLPKSELPVCAGNDEEQPCTRQQFFDGFTKRHPVIAPQTTPIYSNAAFRILSYVIEAVTGQTYASVVQKRILTPLHLTHTSLTNPSTESAGVIPAGENGWDMDLGDETAAGGYYASTSDLLDVGLAILNSTLLSPVQTRTWLKPVTHTSSLTLSIGMPWEIHRTTVNGRVVDLYTKDGSVGMYESLLVLVPDFGVVFTVLTAGPSTSIVDALADLVAGAVLPAFDKVAKEQAGKRYAGIYHAEKVVELNSSLSLVVDDGPGLAVQNWVSNGTDVLALYQVLSDATGGGTLIGSPRVYPTNLGDEGAGDSGAVGTVRQAWRVVFQTQVTENMAVGRSSIFSGAPSTWSSVDELVYGQMAVDELIFNLDPRSGMATGIELPALRVSLTRT